MKLRTLIALTLLAFSLAACTWEDVRLLAMFANSFQPEPTALPVTVTPQPTPVGCVPNRNLPTYTVQAGDTLGRIAQRGQTTVSQLALINCLGNANLIYVGQVLYVPTPIPTPTPVPNVPVVGSISFTPAPTISNNTILLPANTVVNVRWDNAPTQNVAVYEFYVGNQNSRVLIGTDLTPTDGAIVGWLVPGQGTGFFYAEAKSANGTRLARTQTQLPYDVSNINSPIVIGSVNVNPVLRTEQGTLVLPAGGNVSLSWNPNQTLGVVRFYFTPAGTGQSPTIIGTDDIDQNGGTLVYTVPVGMRGSFSADLFDPATNRVLATTQNSVSVMADTTPQPPTILFFVANPTSAQPGTSVNLSWDVVATTGVSIRVLRADGSVVTTLSNLPITSNTNYTIPADATGYLNFELLPATGTMSNPMTVRVDIVQPPPPVVIQSFTVSNAQPAPGETITFSWAVTGATAVSIRPINPDGTYGSWFNDLPVTGTLPFAISVEGTGYIDFQLVPLPEAAGNPISTLRVTITPPAGS